MQKTQTPGSDRNTGDFWLSVPQAVYLEATRDIETAVKLTHDDPAVLIVDVMRRVGRIDIPGDEGAGRREAKEVALRALGPTRGRYDAAMRKLADKLIGGLPIKGRREPGLPLELIDPAEFTGLELSGVNAVNRTTGEVVWYDLRISARAQVKILARESAFEPWESTGDPLPELLEWAACESAPWRDPTPNIPYVPELALEITCSVGSWSAPIGTPPRPGVCQPAQRLDRICGWVPPRCCFTDAGHLLRSQLHRG